MADAAQFRTRDGQMVEAAGGVSYIAGEFRLSCYDYPKNGHHAQFKLCELSPMNEAAVVLLRSYCSD